MKLKYILFGLLLTVCGNLYAVDGNTNSQSNESNATVESSVPQSGAVDGSAPIATGTPSGSGRGASFMAAFGMGDSAVGDSGEAGPGDTGSSGPGNMSSGLSSISSSAGNQVSPPFTPYSYRK